MLALLLLIAAPLCALEFPPFEEGFNLQPEEKIEMATCYNGCKETYEDYIRHFTIGDEYRIPKQIHFIWVGSPLPERCKMFIATWRQFHPDWTITVWTDSEVESFQLVNKQAFFAATNKGQQSDIWRYEILYRYGGVYVDTDFECVKSFDELHKSSEFYAGISRCGTAIFNGLIGARAGHPIMRACIERIQIVPNQRDFHKIMEETGPYYFGKIVTELAPTLSKGSIAIFPPIFFYPYPGIFRGKFDHHAKARFTYPQTMAIHYWHTSWQH